MVLLVKFKNVPRACQEFRNAGDKRASEKRKGRSGVEKKPSADGARGTTAFLTRAREVAFVLEFKKRATSGNVQLSFICTSSVFLCVLALCRFYGWLLFLFLHAQLVSDYVLVRGFPFVCWGKRGATMRVCVPVAEGEVCRD
jgi:hypothetical protein